MTEAARLQTVAVDGKRLSPQGLPDEPGQDHTETAGLSWANYIEQPHDRERKTELLVGSEGEKFVEQLGGGVDPPGAVRGPEN